MKIDFGELKYCTFEKIINFFVEFGVEDPAASHVNLNWMRGATRKDETLASPYPIKTYETY